MVMSHKSNENSENIVQIEAFFCTDRESQKKKQAIRIWEDIVEKFAKRRAESWDKAA